MEAILEAEIDFFAGFGKIFFDRLLVDLISHNRSLVLQAVERGWPTKQERPRRARTYVSTNHQNLNRSLDKIYILARPISSGARYM